MSFMTNLENELLVGDSNTTCTENGALAFRTTGKNLLDLNFAVSSLRSASADKIKDMFAKAFYENPEYAMRWLFYASDVREGLGERRLFRVCLEWLSAEQTAYAKAVLRLIPEYSRWDNILVLLDTSLKDEVVSIIREQLHDDYVAFVNNKPISLISKWLPSCNTSSKESRRKAQIIIDSLGCSNKEYRRLLSKLRNYSNVVEVKMTSKEWDKINYSSVPSYANVKYNNAFLRNDEMRRREYLSKLASGDKSVKINAGVLYPHDIVHKYSYSRYDETLEQLWNNLKDTVDGASNIMTVVDGSGSMMTPVGKNTRVTALVVAMSLGIYFSERLSGEFKDKFITFSTRPKLVDLSNCKSLHDKISYARRFNEVSNTNIEAVFNLILDTAIRNNMKQEELPSTILIMSDMEFDACATVSGSYWRAVNPTAKLFDVIRAKYESHGYKIPRLVFWNICSRSGAIPVRENPSGISLVSGFSVNTVKMVLSNELDPYKCLLEVIMNERYDAVEKAVKL